MKRCCCAGSGNEYHQFKLLSAPAYTGKSVVTVAEIHSSNDSRQPCVMGRQAKQPPAISQSEYLESSMNVEVDESVFADPHGVVPVQHSSHATDVTEPACVSTSILQFCDELVELQPVPMSQSSCTTVTATSEGMLTINRDTSDTMFTHMSPSPRVTMTAVAVPGCSRVSGSVSTARLPGDMN